MGVKKKNIQESLSVPSGLSDAFKEELGRRIVEEVQARTARGIDKDNKKFNNGKGYSDEYKDSLDFKNAGKSSTVNLSSTGDMLAELSVIEIKGSTIVIGYDLGHEDAGKVEGNTIGSYGQSSGNSKIAKDFIGLPDKVVKRLIAEMRSEPEFQTNRADEDNRINSLLGRFFN